MGLFQRGYFLLHSGARSYWKIECDVLTEEDYDGLAEIALERVGVQAFAAVEGVPRGGCAFADVLRHRLWQAGRLPAGDNSITQPVLIVDDVFTTGASMEVQRAGRTAIGLVIFARNPTPSWIMPLFQMGVISLL